MKPIVFNYGQSKLSHAATSVMLRFAYVFAGFATSMGDTAAGMALNQNLDKFSLKHKIAYLEVTSVKKEDDELREFLNKAVELCKAYASLKYKTPQQMVTFKKFEQKLHELFISEASTVKNYLHAAGIAELSKLVDGKSFGFFGIGADDAEEKPNEQYYTASEILTDGYTAEEVAEESDFANVFFLPPHFFDEAFAKQYTLVSAYSEQAQDPGCVYCEELFALPDINAFTAEELKKAKAQLDILSETFKTESVRFFEECYKNESEHNRIAAFTQRVLPAAAAYKQHIQQNEMLQLSRRIYLKDAPAVIVMGEIPIVLLWEFYRYMNFITDKTWCKLQPLMHHENFSHRRWPFFAIKKASFLDEGIYGEQKTEQPMPDARKKFIPVD